MENNTKLYVLFGKSGVGKNEIVDWLDMNRPDFHKVKIDTTRQKRWYEDDESYNFLNKKEFLNKEKNMKYIAYSIYPNGKTNLYHGIPYDKIEEGEKNVVVADLKMVNILKKYYPNDEDIIYISVEMLPQYRFERMTKKEAYPDYYSICKRFCDDDDEFAVKSKMPNKYIVFKNNPCRDDFYGLLKLIDAE